MNSDLYFDGKKYISSSRAAKISGYVNDYIGQLCRDGKLECRMIGRSWYVSFDSLIAHKNSNQSPSKNKVQKTLKTQQLVEVESKDTSPVNFEPQFVTSSTLVSRPDFANLDVPKGAPVETILFESLYVSPISVPSPVTPRVELPLFAFDLQSPLEVKVSEESTPILEEVLEAVDVEHRIKISTVSDEHIITEVSSSKIVEEETALDEKILSEVITPVVSTISVIHAIPKTHHDIFGKKFPTVVGMAVAILISFMGFRFVLDTNPEGAIVYSTISESASGAVTSVIAPVASLGGNLGASAFSGAGTFIADVSERFYLAVNDWTGGGERVLLALIRSRAKQKEYTDDPPIFADEKPTQGMVVVPVTAKTDREATVAKIKSSFSDEVSVRPSADGSDGVIQPVFKRSKGDDYLYVLVPIKN